MYDPLCSLFPFAYTFIVVLWQVNEVLSAPAAPYTINNWHYMLDLRPETVLLAVGNENRF